MCRILIITLSNLGDVVMTTPVFEALRVAYPYCVIDVVADKRSSEILGGAPYLGKIFHREKKGGVIKTIKLISELRETYYDIIIDLRTNLIPVVLRSNKNIFKTKRVSTTQHSVEEHYEAILTLDGVTSPPPKCRLYVEDHAKKEAGELMKSFAGKKLLAIGPGANWPGKIWPATRFEELVIGLETYFDGVIQLGSEGEGIVFSEEVNIPNLDLTGKTNLSSLKAVIKSCQLFIGNDSGLGHVAAALGKRSLTVFGVGDPERYRPWGHQSAVVIEPSKDLRRLKSSRVLYAAKELVEGYL
jgi:ADP-heptose:LPS heptosyltransferase